VAAIYLPSPKKAHRGFDCHFVLCDHQIEVVLEIALGISVLIRRVLE
jgi:hypothetical protein